MVLKVNKPEIMAEYASSKNKEVVKKPTIISEQGDLNRISKIKEQMSSGQYRVDLQALSEKLADELL